MRRWEINLTKIQRAIILGNLGERVYLGHAETSKVKILCFVPSTKKEQHLKKPTKFWRELIANFGI